MRLALVALVFSIAAQAQPSPRPNPDAAPTAYVGGQWWDGERFAPRDTVWAREGVFVDGPLSAARTVDLRGRYVVPPYGDAHTHMLADPYQGPRHAELFERDGVFYVLVLTDRYSWATGVMGRFDGPGSIDVAYSHGGWTSPATHPTQVYEWQALGYVGRELTDAMRREIHDSRLAENDAYWYAETLDDLDAKWDAFLAHEPDVVKVYLLDVAVERPVSRSGMTGLPSGRGLPPEVLRALVRRAHAAGLRVFAHVDTGADMALAVDAGVDGFAHLPGYGYGAGRDDLYLVPDSTAAASAARGVVYVPTSVVGKGRNADRPARAAFARDLHRRQLRALHAAGVPVALGADRWAATSKAEADFFVTHHFFDRATVLDLWTRVTPRTVFPGRAIGQLAAGFEASLLALDCDPLEDWGCTAQIAHREKQGLGLDTTETTARGPSGHSAALPAETAPENRGR